MAEALLSSPDPLNDSPTFQSPVKTRRSSRARQSLLLQGSSPNKQTFELDVGNDISPQKIRVTVEARNSDTENGYTHSVEGRRPATASTTRSRVNRRREKTTTTIIPLKGLSDSEDETQEAATPKRGRGRPRKSAGTPVPARNGGRAGTPTRRRRSVVNPTGEDNENDGDFRIGTSVQVGRGKGRSRSRSMSNKGRDRKRSLLPDEVVVLQDESVEGETEPLGPTEMSGALQAGDGNSAYPPSAYSTIRSTTTIEGNEPDIVIARFEPGNETPRRTGWSSPRIIEGQRTSGPIQDFNDYPSPSNSLGKTANQYGEAQEGEDEIGEMPEFDTVLESEGFSMISVDSVPSLLEHLSSPLSSQEKESAREITNKSLTSIKEIEAAAQDDDSFSSIPEEVLEAATPARKLLNSHLLSVQNSLIEDSFSSIAPEILNDATPARKTQISRVQSLKNSRVDESFSSIPPEILEAATPGRYLPKANCLNLSAGPAYGDSFSAIPSPVLDAATSAPARHTQSQQSSVSQTAASSDRLTASGPSRPTSSQYNAVNSTTNRLPTPEETPSPPTDTSIHQGSEKGLNQEATVVSVNQPSTDESSLHSLMRSSPPSLAPRRYTYTAHLRQRRELYPDLTETPSIVFSSPSLPPPIQLARGQPGLSLGPEETQRPALSPIARAGRVLQDIVAPLSSPRARAQSLRSPFKSPITDRKSSSSVGQSSLSSIHDRTLPPRVDIAGNLFPGPSHHKQWNHSLHHDDPFSNNAPSRQYSSPPEQNQTYRLELPEQRRLSDPRLSTIRSEADSVRSDDGMSWQAEEEVLATNVTTSLVNNVNSSAGERGSSVEASCQNSGASAETLEERWAAERAAVRKMIVSANPSQVIVIDSDDKDPDHVHVEDEEDFEEDFGLLLETLNSSSPAALQRQEPPQENVEKPRRSKIPSPWRKNSKRLVYSDELSHLSSPPVAARVSLAKGFAQKSFTNEDDTLNLSSYPILQKENFKPRIRESRNLDLSALLASSPNKSHLPVLTKRSQNNTSLPERPGSTSTSSLRTESSKGSTSFAPIPQKQDFNPRVRDTGNFEASSVFASSPPKQANSYVTNITGLHSNKEMASHNLTPELSSSSSMQPLSPSSPSKTNTLRVQTMQTPSAELVESEYSYESSLSITSQEEREDQSVDKRTLKWTETVRLASVPMEPFTSPTKSILRSPLKTPSNNSGTGFNISPSKNVAFVSSSPLLSSPTCEPLSSTTWSRDHWLLLDTILQNWKPENNNGSEDGPKGRRRNSTRVISRLLGKKVSSQGQKLKLQQWHLEVVDEFRGIVPGWEEAVIAKRVFALIVGEERRAMGLVGGNQGEKISFAEG